MDNCPKCNSSWIGGSILEEFLKQRDNAKEGGYRFGWTDEQVEESMKECYSPPYVWKREIGIEILGQYDGISYYQCPDCKTTFNRFTGEEEAIEYD